MRQKTFNILFLIAIVLGCVRSPYHVVQSKRVTDTYWLGLSRRIVLGASLSTDGKNLFYGTRRGHVFSVAAEDLDTQWKVNVEGVVNTTPAVSGNAIYVGTSKGVIYSLAKDSGKPLWTQKINGEALGKPTIYKDKFLLVGANDGFLYAFDLSNGEQRWRYRKDLPSRISIHAFAAMAVENSNVYAAFSDGSVSALQGEDGTELWNQHITSSGRFADIVSGVVVASNQVLSAQFDGAFFSLDVSGKVRWNLPSSGSAAPAIAFEKSILVPAADGQIKKIDSNTGETQWTAKMDRPVGFSGLATDGDRLLAATYDGLLYVVDLKNGNVLWHYDLGASILGAPVAVGSKYLALTQKGAIFQITRR